MKITAIKQQMKRSDRFSVYVDGKYVFALSEAELLAVGIRNNQELNEQELSELKSRATVDKGYDRALNLISHRPRSEAELRDYLKRKAYDDESIQKILNKLSNRGYVNDQDFARRWVENRRLLKPVSKRRLVQELRQKRVAADIINEVLAADTTDERDVLRDLIERKRRQTRYQDDLKLMQYLARQGFAYETIKSVLEES